MEDMIREALAAQVKHSIDTAIAGGALASPWWLTYFNIFGNALLIMGGLVLVGFRIAISRRQLKALERKSPGNKS